ncbi:argininosuccinate lyase [Streptomyces sp. NBRC 14336]|uniref:ATP-grasp domain-containing protein n=1 Tax=Streptomyces sp. NBRC 14336 TaxID=3030992 RepID=UPI0024A270C7|nr:ATP-grasp domain-containing protein [Streptomyces sp. NBRC 14336]WBO79462.1 ATP-grasp domain-containing protein [Streptomyces sp. SBE_14.2]GLW49044.1 argininosuccinate lyase [Streptomyces sp. NBRC 14336]
MTSGRQVPATPRLAVLAGTPQLVRAAQALGIATVFVHDASEPAPPVAAEADTALAADLADTGALHAALAPLHAEHPFGRVLSLTERGLLPTAALAERLGLPGNSLRTVRLLQDKQRMRELLNARGIGPVHTAAPRDAADLAEFCRATDGPVVLKPAAGTGSQAVFKVPDARAAEETWRAFEAAGGTEPIAEEYLDGPEISVESFSHDGKHTVLAVTDKLVGTAFVETGHTQPSALPAHVLAEVTGLVHAFLDAVGLVEGPAHTEVKVTAKGPRVLESHNRIGGDKIRELLRRAYGLDVVTLTAACPFGLLSAPTAPPVARRGAAIRFLTPPPGKVDHITLPDTTGTTAEIHLDVEAGAPVRPVRASGDRAGYVIADGTDAAEAARVCEELASRVRIRTSG